MDYYICNKGVYVKLNENGTPITCVKHQAGKFDWYKANNILKSLPKSLQKFRFTLQAIPEIAPPKTSAHKREPEILLNENYEIPQKIQDWAQRAKSCNGLAVDAKCKKDELDKELIEISKEEKLLWHKIQFTKPLDACRGYKVYREMKNLLDRRRDVKDELLIINAILAMDISSMASDRIQKCVDGLKNRVYGVPELSNEKVGV